MVPEWVVKVSQACVCVLSWPSLSQETIFLILSKLRCEKHCNARSWHGCLCVYESAWSSSKITQIFTRKWESQKSTGYLVGLIFNLFQSVLILDYSFLESTEQLDIRHKNFALEVKILVISFKFNFEHHRNRIQYFVFVVSLFTAKTSLAQPRTDLVILPLKIWTAFILKWANWLPIRMLAMRSSLPSTIFIQRAGRIHWTLHVIIDTASCSIPHVKDIYLIRSTALYWW